LENCIGGLLYEGRRYFVGNMQRFLYTMAMRVAAPAAKLWIAASPRHRPLIQRFSPPLPDSLENPVWVQACSVGEVGVSEAVIKEIAVRWPHSSVLATTSTRSGHALAETRLTGTPLSWFPFDHPRAVRQFFDRAAPRALVLIETELWPLVIEEATRRNVPVVVLNARLSERHFPRYRRMGAFGRAIFANLSAVAAQNSLYAERFAALGTPQARIHVTGNIKFDGVADSVDDGKVEALRAAWPIPAGAPLIVFGSTRPGDEALAENCWRSLRTQWPDLRLVVTVRHVERAAEAAACFEYAARRSNLPDRANAPVLVVDTIGELTAFYSMADIAVVGGSFYPGVNGHNPLEPAALAIPTVFGPYMNNFADAATALTEAGGAVQLEQPEELTAVLQNMLRDPAARRDMAQCGREAIAAQRGALTRNLDVLAPFIEETS
jgi:3-deoxy-D-manno-octulosonic-acid transferase